MQTGLKRILFTDTHGSNDTRAQKKNAQETHQEMRYPNVTSLYFATTLAFNAPDGVVPLRK